MTLSGLGFRKSAATEEVAGDLRLVVERRGHQTRPSVTKHTGVLRLMQPLYLDDSGQMTYIIMNPGGAYFAETYRLSIEVGPGSHLLLSNQGATRIYKTPTGPAVQEADFTLHPGSRLEYLPDQTIAYRDADYRQITRIVASPDAQAFFGEIVTPGWDPEDIRFTYIGMHLRLDILSEDGRFVCTDNIRILPAQLGDSIEGIGYMEGASHMGSAILLGSHITGNYVDRVREVVESFGLAKAGVTTGNRHGVSWLMVRALANSTDELQNMIRSVNELDRSVTTGQGRVHLRRY